MDSSIGFLPILLIVKFTMHNSPPEYPSTPISLPPCHLLLQESLMQQRLPNPQDTLQLPRDYTHRNNELQNALTPGDRCPGRCLKDNPPTPRTTHRAVFLLKDPRYDMRGRVFRMPIIVGKVRDRVEFKEKNPDRQFPGISLIDMLVLKNVLADEQDKPLRRYGSVILQSDYRHLDASIPVSCLHDSFSRYILAYSICWMLYEHIHLVIDKDRIIKSVEQLRLVSLYTVDPARRVWHPELAELSQY